MMSYKVEVYSSFYKKYHIYSDNVIKPFFVGAKERQNDLGIPGDDTGDNISDKNGTFNELTLIYWVWKNTQGQDYVGFCHYRRYFTYSKNSNLSKVMNLIFSRAINKEKKVDNILKDFSDTVVKDISGFDVILPRPIIMERTLREQYGDYHDVAHYDAMGEMIKKIHPEVYDSFLDASKRNSFFIANMFIFSRDIFEKFCEFAFPVLFALEKDFVIPDDPYQKRIFGYLGERLVTIFMNHLSRQQELKIKYLNLLNTDIIFGNVKSYLSERKSLAAKNYITFGHVDTLIDMNDDTFSINGWGIVKKQTSYDIICQVELYNGTDSFIYNTEIQNRRDVTLAFSRESKKYTNHDSSGFYTLISKKQIPTGKYKIKLHLISKEKEQKCVYYVIDCYIHIDKAKVELIRI